MKHILTFVLCVLYMLNVLDNFFPEHCQHSDPFLVKISLAPLPVFKFVRLRIEAIQVIFDILLFLLNFLLYFN